MDVLNYINKRNVVLTGHYGSGKTELAINFAIGGKRVHGKVALIDLDIANPYFRSRERKDVLSDKDIELIGNAYDCDITADLPALSPRIEKVIVDKDYHVVIDAGGNDSGARILNQYKEALKKVNAHILIVVNIYRPETDNAEKVIGMIRSIEREIGREVHGIVNNSNLLSETQLKHIASSVELLESVSGMTGIPIVANCCKREFYNDLCLYCSNVFPIDLFMRPRWLDI